MLHKVENRQKKRNFLSDDLSKEWTTHHTRELIIGIGDLNGHVVKNIVAFPGVHGGFCIGGVNQDGKMLLEYSMQITYASPTHGLEWLT